MKPVALPFEQKYLLKHKILQMQFPSYSQYPTLTILFHKLKIPLSS